MEFYERNKILLALKGEIILPPLANKNWTTLETVFSASLLYEYLRKTEGPGRLFRTASLATALAVTVSSSAKNTGDLCISQDRRQDRMGSILSESTWIQYEVEVHVQRPWT